MKSIVLIGYMGAGKSAIGRMLSSELKLRFVDLDRLIEKKEGTSISEMFNSKGEEYFRLVENRILLELSLEKSPVILATGGGIVEKEENYEPLKKIGTVFFLHNDIDILWKRVGKDQRRPLSLDYDSFVERYNSRLEKYRKLADYEIECSGAELKENGRKIMEILNENSCN